jgi:hypothetical protein
MKRARFMEEQIIGVLREHEAGAKAADLARKHGVSEATLYNWNAKYGRMDVLDAKRPRQSRLKPASPCLAAVKICCRMTIGAGGSLRHHRKADDKAPNWRSAAPTYALAALLSMRRRVIGGVQLQTGRALVS